MNKSKRDEFLASKKAYCLIPKPEAKSALTCHEYDYCSCDLKDAYSAGFAEAQAQAKVLIDALKNPFICVYCNEREPTEWGKVCKVKEDSCCTFKNDISEELEQYRKAVSGEF